jgi:hypothetical protein
VGRSIDAGSCVKWRTTAHPAAKMTNSASAIDRATADVETRGAAHLELGEENGRRRFNARPGRHHRGSPEA